MPTPGEYRNSPWDVAIVGSGMTGLGAARTLSEAGQRIILLDKEQSPGGRVASFRQNGCIFDGGAQNIKARGSLLEAATASLSRNLIRPFAAPIWMHREGASYPGDERSNTEEKWAITGGLEALARELGRGLPLRMGTHVERIVEHEGEFVLFGADDSPLLRARRVIVTAPGPQAADLLAASTLQEPIGERIEVLRSIAYTRCLSVLLRYDAPLDAPWYALLSEDRDYPLLWLARENAKGYVLSGRQTAFVAQLGPKVSDELYDAPDDEVARHTIGWIREIANELRPLPAPAWWMVKRWRYSQAQGGVDNPAGPTWEQLNPSGAKILLAGDALCAKSRVELAYESGVRAAQQMVAA